MIHLTIISASNLPSSKKNKYCNSYAVLYPQNFDFPSIEYYGKTKTIKNTPNPEWNHEFIIPFVICSSIRVEIWESKALSNQIIGTAYIYLQPETFYQKSSNTPETTNITLSKPSNDSRSILTYSFSSSLSSFDIKPAKKTQSVYAYLSFDPPIQPFQQEESQLFVCGVNDNGTIVDPISDIYTRGENEAIHCGPTGPTQVFYFRSMISGIDHNYSIYDQYFFYVKNSGYSGKITLNFLTTPYSISYKKFLNETYIFNNQWTVYVNNKNANNHSYTVFPIQLYFSKEKAFVSPITIPESIIHISIQDRPNMDTNCNVNDTNLFSAAFNYYHNDLDGIAIKSIKDTIGQILCRPCKKLHYRFEILPGNRYSLIGAFDYNNIDYHPSKIMVGLGWDTFTDLDASILQFCEDGKQLMPVCFYNKSNKNSSIKTTGDNLTGDGAGDDERIYLKLDEIPSNIKYLAIVITSYRNVPFDQINGAFCRIEDCISHKEVMYLNLSKKEKYTGLLFAVMARLDGVWDMWPCIRYFDGTCPDDAQKFFDNFVQSGIIDQMLTI